MGPLWILEFLGVWGLKRRRIWGVGCLVLRDFKSGDLEGLEFVVWGLGRGLQGLEVLKG